MGKIKKIKYNAEIYLGQRIKYIEGDIEVFEEDLFMIDILIKNKIDRKWCGIDYKSIKIIKYELE